MAEIALFLGPFLALLLVKGVSRCWRHGGDFAVASWLVLATLVAALATGFLPRGETARVCLFVFPFLLVPVGHYLDRLGITRGEERQLLSLVFFQTAFMQLIGDYFW